MADFTSEILSNIIRGKRLLSDLNVKYIQHLRSDVPFGEYELYLSLFKILKALDIKVSSGVFDTVAEVLYKLLILLIGWTNPSGANKTVRWGYFSGLAPQDPSLFDFQFSASMSSGASSYNLNFSSAILSSDKGVVIEEDSDSPVKRHWFNTELNKGDLTAGDYVFKDPIVVSNKRYYVSKNIVVFDGSNTSLLIST